MANANLNNNLAEAQFYRNGGNRYFLIESLTETGVTYQEYDGHGATGKIMTMNRSTFVQLLKNKYMTLVNYRYDQAAGRWTENRDWAMERQYEFNRCLVKQGIKLI